MSEPTFKQNLWFYVGIFTVILLIQLLTSRWVASAMMAVLMVLFIFASVRAERRNKKRWEENEKLIEKLTGRKL